MAKKPVKKIVVVLTCQSDEEVSVTKIRQLLKEELEAINDCMGFGEEGVAFSKIVVRR
jgi:hypothetical protein